MGRDFNAENKSKIKLIIYGTIIIGLLIFLIQYIFFIKSPVEKELDEIANRLNKLCPHQMDSKTLIESVNVESSNTVTLNFVLFEINKSIYQTKNFRDSIYSNIRGKIKQDEFFRPLYINRYL